MCHRLPRPLHLHIVGARIPWADREKYPAKFDIDRTCAASTAACAKKPAPLTPSNSPTYEYDMVGLTRSEMIFDKEKVFPRSTTKRSEKTDVRSRVKCHKLQPISN